MISNNKPTVKTEIEHKHRTLNWENKSGVVGASVKAYLHPQDSKKGSATSSGTDGYTAIDKKVAEANHRAWARGHLLNHDLGGMGRVYNLYPITAGANSRHAEQVEYPVKALLNKLGRDQKDGKTPVDDRVYYRVDAIGTPDNAKFVCEWGISKATSDSKPQKLDRLAVVSKLKRNKKEKVERDRYGNTVKLNSGAKNTGTAWTHDTLEKKPSETKGSEEMSNNEYSANVESIKQLGNIDEAREAGEKPSAKDEYNWVVNQWTKLINRVCEQWWSERFTPIGKKVVIKMKPKLKGIGELWSSLSENTEIKGLGTITKELKVNWTKKPLSKLEEKVDVTEENIGDILEELDNEFDGVVKLLKGEMNKRIDKYLEGVNEFQGEISIEEIKTHLISLQSVATGVLEDDTPIKKVIKEDDDNKINMLSKEPVI
ncbi:hypothetical protein CWB96_06325 [Pseudoalteromonas citrea]|uniref:DNA/RNA non-specific endonuclease n=1 Tax=Pseudoalteromonas citrea TaxID=43655 RepID=A0A5S3XTQ2_9GAMM|nr:hypothetical protein [Pseudoalteromonas citrea]TMP41802.1 hypothetical protein CWB97_13635 [Pseudoalteromonas citrea]TMP60579.1 hypothetical protein CWB96_06325 [Pseudoalteromonas citrea]